MQNAPDPGCPTTRVRRVLCTIRPRSARPGATNVAVLAIPRSQPGPQSRPLRPRAPGHSPSQNRVKTTASTPPRDSRYGWFHRRAADLLLFLTFIVAAIPETSMPDQVVSGAQHALWPYLLAAVFIFTGYLGRRQGMHAMLAVLCFAALWMLTVGGLYLRDEGVSKSFGGDL